MRTKPPASTPSLVRATLTPRRSRCPVACALDLLGDRWTLLVVRDLMRGKRRFAQLQDSPETIATMEKYEKTEQYDAQEYQDIIFNNIYTQYICRLDPWPDPLMRSLKHFNSEIYNIMQGPNEFVITGNFKSWNVWDKLDAIKVPTLLIGAKYDEMDPDDIRRMASLVPNSRLQICNGSHLSMYDDQQNYFNGLIRFLKDVEANNFKKD